MTDAIKPSRTDTYQSLNETGIEPFGAFLIQTPVGLVQCVEVPGYTTLVRSGEAGPDTVILMVYSPPVSEDGAGVAMGVQISSSVARQLGASLIEVANQIDGGGGLQ